MQKTTLADDAAPRANNRIAVAIGVVMDPITDADRRWFEEHPGAEQYIRSAIEGEFEPVLDSRIVLHVIVSQVPPAHRLRIPVVLKNPAGDESPAEEPRASDSPQFSSARTLTIKKSVSNPNGTSGDHSQQRCVYEFTVTFPWGAEFSEALRSILLDLGYHVVVDPANVGSPDDWGWYASRNKDHLETILHLANEAEDQLGDHDAYEEACDAVNRKLDELVDVYVFYTDWKCLDPKETVPRLEEEYGFELSWTEEGKNLYFTLVA